MGVRTRPDEPVGERGRPRRQQRYRLHDLHGHRHLQVAHEPRPPVRDECRSCTGARSQDRLDLNRAELEREERPARRFRRSRDVSDREKPQYGPGRSAEIAGRVAVEASGAGLRGGPAPVETHSATTVWRRPLAEHHVPEVLALNLGRPGLAAAQPAAATARLAAAATGGVGTRPCTAAAGSRAHTAASHRGWDRGQAVQRSRIRSRGRCRPRPEGAR